MEDERDAAYKARPDSRAGGSTPATRVPSAGSGSAASAASGRSTSSMSHRDVVRARREAMEKARQESLQNALHKKDVESSGVHETDVEALERQIEQGGHSAAALVGLRKRLAMLKAQAVREERVAAQRQREAEAARHAEARYAQQATPSSQRAGLGAAAAPWGNAFADD